MTTVLVVIHVLVSLLLIFIVLVQGGKGAELGATFGGGSSQTVFGGRGAATFLNKMTTAVAVVFMLSSLLLAIVSVKGTSVVKSVTTKTPETAAPATGQLPAGSQLPLEPGPVPQEGSPVPSTTTQQEPMPQQPEK